MKTWKKAENAGGERDYNTAMKEEEERNRWRQGVNQGSLYKKKVLQFPQTRKEI